ncbi:hypothetical protein EV363DRAFT_1405257 [Boletus edulis]|nr:hypothetical protein EV363DRAFT_1405257 [Boletus edulis]
MEAHLFHSVAQVGTLALPALAPSPPQLSYSPFPPFSSLSPSPSSSPSLSGLPRLPFGPVPPPLGSFPSPPSPATSPPPSLATSSPAPAVLASHYEPLPSRPFDEADRSQGLHKVMCEKAADRIVEHPRDVIVEYPETGNALGVAVAHIFNVDPNAFCHPRLNFQYSLGDGHGGRDEVICKMLRSVSGKPVVCSKLRTTCRGLRYCSFRPQAASSHSFTSRQAISFDTAVSHAAASSPTDSAHVEVFQKTLAFFCALSEKGCGFSSADDFPACDTIEQENDPPLDIEESSMNNRRRKTHRCHGQLELRHDNYNQPYIHSWYLCVENHAKSLGIGPLAPCTFAASPREQKATCCNDEKNKLRRSVLSQSSEKCTTSYDIYVPNNLHDCTSVLILSTNPHNHLPPLPIKTPPQIVECFKALLLHLEWKLADATPRRLVLNSGFIHGLCHALAWSRYERDPSLHDLHPSLGNLDHLRRLINNLRTSNFPHGTGFHGAKRLAVEHEELPLDHRYLRCVELYDLPSDSDGKFQLVVCMSHRMLLLLVQAKRISIDTSFKRVCSWQEFEIEGWDNFHQRSMVLARAFTTSQSADAHVFLLRRIFSIAEQDTGVPVTFFHIHGTGIESVVADGHHGQALGLGKFCIELCRHNQQLCTYESHRHLQDLDPYDHLRRFFRVCIVHFKRNIRPLKHEVSHSVIEAMYSIASAEPHQDFEATLTRIRRGGAKARAWLKDKETSKFMIPALYQPPHRNINRDGTGLTLIAGIMRGQQHDMRMISGTDLHISHGINTRDILATHTFRAIRTITRTGKRSHSGSEASARHENKPEKNTYTPPNTEHYDSINQY